MNSYYFPINGQFTNELLVQFLNMVNNIGPEEKLIITLSSPGGELSVFYTMLHVINSNPDKFEILVTEVVESCAFYLILMADCEINLLDSAGSAVYHFAFFSAVDSNTYDDKDDEFMVNRKKELTKLNKHNLAYMAKLGADKEKLARISKGKDVSFNRKEILAFLKNKQKNKITYGVRVNLP